MVRHRLSILVVVLLLCGGPAASQRPASPGEGANPVWGDLQVPGGPRELLASAGLATTIEEWRAVPAVIEQFYGGRNPRVPREFRAYGVRQAKAADSRAPLPLGADFWARVPNLRPSPGGLLPSILASRAASALYYGLLSMDTATLAAIRADTELGSTLIRHAERLPVHAKAIRVRAGQIDPAGGEALAPFWTDLVGRLDDPASFVEAVLTRDDGRLGFFYNTIDAMPAAAMPFITGSPRVAIELRRKRFLALYAVVSTSMPTWDGRDRRFFPIRGGPAAALFAIALDRDGLLVGPPWLDFWSQAFVNGRPSEDIDVERLADAADLLRQLCPAGRCDEERVHTLEFIQRQPDARSRDNAGALLQAARTRRRFPALALELEQLRLADLTIYPAADAIARRIDELPRERARAALAQFQGALSLLRRFRATGMPRDQVRRHFASLVAVPVHADGYRAGVLRWLVVDVLDAASGDMDEAAIRALAGTTPPGQEIEWEGLRYRVDVASTEAARIRTVRSRFRGPDLAAAWDLLARGERGADAAAADAIAALVYSVTLQDGSTPLALSRELPQRHDFFGRVPGEPLPPPWTLPSVRITEGAVRHIGGSLLGLESGAPELASRRLGGDRPGDRARISPVFAEGILRTAALASLWTDSTDDATRIVNAAARGRPIASDPSTLEPALAAAGIAGPRAGWIRWAISRGDPQPASVLRLEDLMRLGDPGITLTSVGAAALPYACLCLQQPSVSWELRGQPPDHFLAASLALEAPLRVAYELRTRGLPSVLVPGVLSLLASDVVESGALAHPADVHGTSDTVRRLAATRFDDYIAAVAARGPLVPVSSGGTNDR